MSERMIQIKFLGKGGQGVVVASEILARACFEENLYPQCFSLYGGERRGATVAAFVRVDKKKIYLKCDIDRPDHLILFDKSLCDQKEVVEQVEPGGHLLINMDKNDPLNGLETLKVGRINALEISKRIGLGAIVNTAILGAYVRLTNVISLNTLLKVISETVPAAAGQNVMAAKEGYERLSFV
jgi:2-oxoacid:acceptor oxidoreductase gamma subunit (pyruvate/2-ketoisovalerate family)